MLNFDVEQSYFLFMYGVFFIFFKNYFAECPFPSQALGKVFFLKKIKKTLPSAWAGALGKVFFF